MQQDERIYRIFQEVHQRTLTENQEFDRAFSQLPPEAQRLIDERLGTLLYATITAAAEVGQRQKRRL